MMNFDRLNFVHVAVTPWRDVCLFKDDLLSAIGTSDLAYYPSCQRREFFFRADAEDCSHGYRSSGLRAIRLDQPR